MSAMLTTEIEGPAAWRGAVLAVEADWRRELSRAEIADLDSALARVRKAGKRFPDVAKADFPLPAWHDTLARLADELENGRGFHLMRGLPVDRYDADEIDIQLDEVNRDYYGGREIVLDPMIREYLLLEAPMKPLCSEGCEGIPVPEHLRPPEEVFGASAPDARFAPLMKLKEELTKNEE